MSFGPCKATPTKPSKYMSVAVYVAETVAVSVAVCVCVGEYNDVYRVAKTHRVPYLYRSFSAKLTYI